MKIKSVPRGTSPGRSRHRGPVGAVSFYFTYAEATHAEGEGKAS